MRSGQPVNIRGIDFKGFDVDFDGFGAGRVPGVMPWARLGSWLDSGRGWGLGCVDPWGVRGFVDGFVDSWVRELVAGFVGLWIGLRAFGFVW